MQPQATYPGAQGGARPKGTKVLALIPSEDDPRILSLALTLSGLPEGRVAAWSLPDEARTLRQRLRAAMLGIRGSGEASRALRYMVEASARGHHVPVRILPAQRAERSPHLDEFRKLPEGALLVTGWSRGSPLPTDPCFGDVLRAHPGELLVMMECPPTPFSSVLLVSFHKGQGDAYSLSSWSTKLAGDYPAWIREVDDLAGLEALLCKTMHSDLVIVSSLATKPEELEPLLDRLRVAASTSTVGVLLPHHESREPLLRWLASAATNEPITLG